MFCALDVQSKTLTNRVSETLSTEGACSASFQTPRACQGIQKGCALALGCSGPFCIQDTMTVDNSASMDAEVAEMPQPLVPDVVVVSSSAAALTRGPLTTWDMIALAAVWFGTSAVTGRSFALLPQAR
jgi:hypothetical protein